MKHQPIIGLEVHVQLATKSGMFCGCAADSIGMPPNSNTCPVCLGLPGALPVPNKKAIEWTILLGLALGCKINEVSRFDRKNYFYPDLPKGYQISQYDQPLCFDGKFNEIRIRRVHLEEDTGRLQHAEIDGEQVSLVDFNRSGVPLAEIVTEPDFRSLEDVDKFLKKLQQIIRYLGISNADMEKGSMRIEPSISIAGSVKREALSGNTLPNYRVELKNINSFRFARKAIEYEIKRQSEMIERGEAPSMQTRGWNEGKGETVVQREKEEAHDYRYFPEPDIPPMRWSTTQISELRTQIPELPDAKRTRFIKDYGLNEYDASLLTETRQKADYFEETVKVREKTRLDSGNQRIKSDQVTPKIIANWIINRAINFDAMLPTQLVRHIAFTTQGANTSDDELEKTIEEVVRANPKAAADYKKGKAQALGFLVGQAMRLLKGKGTATQITEMIKKRLDSGSSPE